MTQRHLPRLLVVDDDLGVIAAYRLVLEKAPERSTVHEMFGLGALEAELFGDGDDLEAPPQQEWRIDFLDQGLDAVKMVEMAMADGDPFTAVFLDVRMPPGIDGYETAMRVRQLDAKAHIVVVTAFCDYSYEDFVDVAGPAEKLTYMPKPVWPDQLRKVAQTLTRQTSHRSQLSPTRAVHRM